jgi:hypothetical protein
MTASSGHVVALAFSACMAGTALAFSCAAALAQEAPRAAPETLSPEAAIEISPAPAEGKTTPEVDLSAPPPTRPRHRGVVLETDLGVLGFAGRFRHVAPTAYWLHTQLGVEALPWLLVFAEAELAFTDTSEAQDESHAIAFPIWGFGGGIRGTIHASDRVAFFVQGEIGALAAIVPHDALAVVGFRAAESLNLAFGGRLGAEWYQLDRHFALRVSGGPRIAQGFARSLSNADTPLMWDVGVGLRYTF